MIMVSNPVIVIENVSFSYNDEPVLEDVNLTISAREFVWIVGPNGGGKTTLVKIVLGLLRPRRGKVTVFGASASASRRRIGYMPQHAQLDLRFPVTVMDVALMGRLTSGIRPGPYSGEDRDSAGRALELTGLAVTANRPLGELSGGQHRRLLIARALACEPELLLLDEPTANLDRRVERELYELLRKLNEHLTIVMVSHDPAFVSDFVKQVVCVNHTVAVHPTSEMERLGMEEIFGPEIRLVRHDRHRRGEKPEGL